ncbi:alpha/beta fold hydrolase [Microbacterium amylolyticum]|uniref:Pimeloyl-ACP methyl ester carboxylesterase n=1 Tax=Microbacterium amylolyticum TaxID=936337 RepID=A0ABS4ZJT5_9MICO|nr:alpha/beta hydrolase [Microbacterium amylolyticum]MBP2437298.1 pimeloyl-ACP methyl ester carboxylesterase [Microbacterium amylolyticum]
MNVMLIAGFWLDGSSWSRQVAALEAAGHTVFTPTLPGFTPGESSDVGLSDQIDAIIDLIDHQEGPVALVGHSGGAFVAWGAADARPDRIARVIFVDAVPPSNGMAINPDLPVENGTVPFPRDHGAFFDDSEFQGFSAGELAEFIAAAIPVPARVASDPIRLTNERRWEVPVTVLATSFPCDQITQLMESGHPMTAELMAIRQLEIIDLPTGHWPQLTEPEETSSALAEALEETGSIEAASFDF